MQMQESDVRNLFLKRFVSTTKDFFRGERKIFLLILKIFNKKTSCRKRNNSRRNSLEAKEIVTVYFDAATFQKVTEFEYKAE